MLSKVALIATVALGSAIGFAWPFHETRSVAATEVTISQESDRHYYADAEVNGHRVRFMIDTGASETVLTEADARSVGIQTDPRQIQVIGDGASGMVRGQMTNVRSINLQGLRQSDAVVAVVPGASVSLLGQPFLEQIDEIVIRKGEMRLRNG